MPPSTTSTSVRPRPIAMASITLCSGRFLEAKASTRASTMQLVVMSGMKIPSTRYSGCTKAFIARSITVTSAAMMRTKTGMRISFGTKWRTHGHRAAGRRHHQHGRQSQRQRVDHVVADRQQRAQAEQLHQAGVLLDRPLWNRLRNSCRVMAGVSLLGCGVGATFAASSTARLRAKYSSALVHRLDHRARGDGGAGAGVERPPSLVTFQCLGFGFGQRFADELVDPGALGAIDVVAQPGRFAVGGDAHAGDVAVGIDADQQAISPL